MGRSRGKRVAGSPSGVFLATGLSEADVGEVVATAVGLIWGVDSGVGDRVGAVCGVGDS